MHAVVLGQTEGADSPRIITLASTGEIWMPSKDQIVFAIPGIVPTDVALRCGVSESGQTQKEVMARVEVLRRMRELEKLVARDQSRVAHRIDMIYPMVKAADPNRWSKVTVAKVVKLLEPYMKTSSITHFAVHKHLTRLSHFYVMDYFDYRVSRSVDVRPAAHVEHISKISEMLRMKNGPIDAFAARAKAVIASNRKRALESRNEPPSLQLLDGSVFTPDDIVIIEFLRHSLRATRNRQTNPYDLGQSVIIKKLDACTDIVRTQDVFQVLVDLGVVPPWQDLISYSFESFLDVQPVTTSDKELLPDAHATPHPTTHAIAQGAYRHDFGDMPVYVIDDTSAKERDDGVSLESDPSEPGAEWVHVHIADPTSVISPKGKIARMARNQTQTCYWLHKTVPMLPPSMVHNGLSLGSSQKAGEPQEVVTFSFRIDSEGNIGDYKVRLGLVRNIQVLNYDGVDSLLGVSQIEEYFLIGIRGSSPASLPNLDQSHLNNLRVLYGIARRLVKARLRLPTFIQAPRKLSITLSPTPTDSMSPDLTKTASYRGFPDVVYKIMPAKAADHGARQLVSELMKAACRIASLFCLDHGIPVLRRTAPAIQTKSRADLDELLALRDEDGYVDYLEPMRLGASTPPSAYSLEPGMHWSLGIAEGKGYVRVTSPLRRYVDLLAHWQIKHALSNTTGKPPFSEAFLKDCASLITADERTWRRANLNHEKYWALLALQRLLGGDSRSDGDRHVLDNLTGVTLMPVSMNLSTKRVETRVRLPTLGFDAVLTCDEQMDLPLGTELPVKIDSILLDPKPKLHLVIRR